MKRYFLFLFVFTVCLTSVFAYDSTSAATDQQAAQSLLDEFSYHQWLGPLAPIALSPFFGMACLSGASLLVHHGWLPENSALMGNPALNNETVCITLIVLALFTSLPRLTKVSKPLAQLGDFLETYAGIVLVLVIQYIGMKSTSEMPGDGLVHASLLGSSGFVLLAIASVINLAVIQSVRFFFELLIFLSPIPFIDMCFEVINKTVCLTLIAVYVFHPGAAFILNILMFLLCLSIFRRVHRKAASIREKILVPIGRRIWSRVIVNKAG